MIDKLKRKRVLSLAEHSIRVHCIYMIYASKNSPVKTGPPAKEGLVIYNTLDNTCTIMKYDYKSK